jgi:hypothetical protein
VAIQERERFEQEYRAVKYAKFLPGVNSNICPMLSGDDILEMLLRRNYASLDKSVRSRFACHVASRGHRARLLPGTVKGLLTRRHRIKTIQSVGAREKSEFRQKRIEMNLLEIVNTHA